MRFKVNKILLNNWRNYLKLLSLIFVVISLILFKFVSLKWFNADLFEQLKQL